MMLARRISSVGPSATIAITARAKQMQADGIDVISFGAGEPDFDTPDFIKEAAIAALRDGDTKYTPRRARALKEAIARKLATENGLEYGLDQIVVTFGSKHALHSACQVLLEPGDKALIPAPYWNSYPEMVKLAAGVPVILPTRRQDSFKLSGQQVLDAAGGAKILILASPSNPTSITYTPDELADIAQAVLQTDLIVFSDECYEKLVYGQTKFVSFATLDPRLPERTVTFNSLSKPFAMTGWRIGWLAGPKDLADAVSRLMSHQTTNPVSFVQAGAVAAYSDPRRHQVLEEMRIEFEKRARHMAERLNAMEGVVCVEPTGAFYCFPDVSAHYGRTLGSVAVTDSLSFAKAALEFVKVALVPGAAFGEDTCVRLCFATTMQQIDEGLDRLERLLG